MIFYTADMHFGHRNVIKFDGRPFRDTEEMDEYIIERWNERVSDRDTVYILGDVCYRNAHPASWYLKRLKGHKYLITGNHEKAVLSEPNALKLLDGYDQIKTIRDGDKQIVLCHYPMAEWPGLFQEAWHIYGHIHNNKTMTYELMAKLKRALNAGCMINNYVPVTFDELLENNRRFREE